MKRRDFIKTGICLGCAGALSPSCALGSPYAVGSAQDALKDPKHISICSLPWTYFEIHKNKEGKNIIYPCCPDACRFYSFGTLSDTSFEDIWYGERAENFREKMKTGEYPLCNLNVCGGGDTYLSEVGKFYDENGKVKKPVKFNLCDDKSCNVACITCRDEIIIDEAPKDDISSLYEDVETLMLSGSGDPFASPYYRKILKELTKKNKKCKFHICTNGILMTKRKCKNLGILSRIEKVEISLPGVKKETYDEIVKFGNHEKVLENIEWISKDSTIETKQLNFVVHRLNYKEIPDLIALALSKNFTFWISHFRDWGTEYGKKYNEAAIWLPEHPEHQEFLEVMSNELVKKYPYNFNGLLSSFIGKV